VNAGAVQEWKVAVGSETVSVRLDPAVDSAGDARARVRVFVFAHGAGGHMLDRNMQAMTRELCARGLTIARFNFPYRERKSSRPDPMPILTQSIANVTAFVRDAIPSEKLILGGRSMGGRAASMLAANAFHCDGLLLLAYPLHPAGQPAKLRDAHLARIHSPTLCFNGTRDPLCRRDLMDAVVARLPSTFRMHWLEGADHSFRVLKSSGRADADVLREVGSTTEMWLSEPTGVQVSAG
jgi:predicted alpha/beta-hydrolase family hydrolase